MAENDPILEQRVEALEQFSQTRVVEQVGDLTERVSALESARTAENPYLASKADVARLEAQHIATQGQIAAQSEQFSKDLQAQSEVFNARLAAQSERFGKDLQAQSERFDNAQKAQTEQLRRDWEERINKLISWMVVAIISFIGTAVAFAALILNRLPV
ncbi:MAG: hypothetical protein OXN94_06950 [Chloroflexota bacterium]|nr:hypothetical protein [Chloroflexota bacterium]